MSGDVQPRKRKDKRRKKADGDYHIQRIRSASIDDDDAGTPPPTLINPSSEHSTDNVTIHVHKEGGTGGHWCARILFFALLSILVGLIGLIIFEHRGITDVDTPVAASRWAVIFDGWVDDIIPQHDDPHEGENNASEETDEHGDDESEEEEVEEEEEEDEEEEDDEHGDHEESEEEEEEGTEEKEEEEEETEKNVVDKDTSEVDEGIGSEEEAEEQEEDEEEEDEERNESENEENDEADESQQISVEEQIYRRNVREASREPASDQRDLDSKEEKFDDGFDEDNFVEENEDTLEELDDNSEEETNDVSAGDEEDNDENDEAEEEEANHWTDNDLDVSIEGVKASKETDEDDVSPEYFSIPGVGEIEDNSAEPLEEIEDGDLEEVVNELAIEPEEEEEIEEESANVAVKFGVGVALIVAAHFVLVRRWNNVEADLAGSYSDELLDLSRRNTIVPLMNPKETIASKEMKEQATIHDEKIIKNYEELRNQYKNLEVETPVSAKKILGTENIQLRNISMQEKSLAEDRKPLLRTDTREKEEEIEEMQTSESERLSATEEEEEVSEEEEQEEEEDEDEEEDIEEPDDSELVAKLEAKYGKLPTPTESEEEEDYDDEDEDAEEDDEEAEEEDEEIQGWKRVKAPKGAHSGGPEQRRETKEKEPVAKGTSSSQSGGKSSTENVNESNIDEVSIQEEINSWFSKEFDN